MIHPFSHLRWGIEENYKRLKQWVEIESLSGKSTLSIKQGFYAKIVASKLKITEAVRGSKNYPRKLKNMNNNIHFCA